MPLFVLVMVAKPPMIVTMGLGRKNGPPLGFEKDSKVSEWVPVNGPVGVMPALATEPMVTRKRIGANLRILFIIIVG